MTAPREDGYTRDPRPHPETPAGGGAHPPEATPAAASGSAGRGPGRAITPGLVIGLFVIGLGLVLFFEQLGRDTGSLLRWWPVVLIVLGAFKVTERPGRGFGLVLLAGGTALLLDNLGLIAISDWWFLWPVVVIGVGALLVWRALRTPGARAGAGRDDGTFRALAVLGGVERRFTSRAFAGGEASAVLGSCEVDLLRSEMAGEEAVIEVFALLGGVKLTVPDGWEVDVRGTPLLGAFEDRTRPSSSGVPAPRLIVQGAVILAGVEIHGRPAE